MCQLGPSHHEFGRLGRNALFGEIISCQARQNSNAQHLKLCSGRAPRCSSEGFRVNRMYCQKISTTTRRVGRRLFHRRVDIQELRSRLGSELALWGGVQVEHLIAGTTDEVRTDMRRAFRVALETPEAGSGGFVIGTSHSVAVGTQYDNFMAMLDEYQKMCAKYCG